MSGPDLHDLVVEIVVAELAVVSRSQRLEGWLGSAAADLEIGENDSRLAELARQLGVDTRSYVDRHDRRELVVALAAALSDRDDEALGGELRVLSRLMLPKNRPL